ncbi:MAG: CaiB/BaiF CoA-transferase family protein [Alphaproteobacteria bacterium]|nr:CaiB/BaiF CoA-transferase family protein [Alphaproteobacteria bacterium]
MLLNGIKVIEHATYFAAPGAGGILSDWGAEVIKIEPPGGDPVRHNFPTKGTGKEHLTDNPAFDGDNRGKKSIVVDTRTEDGREIVRKLADTADVFLTNVRPGGIERSGLGYDILSRRNPRLVYCALTGYGLEGPDANAPGFDVASFWSRSGIARLTAPKGSELFPIRTAAGDHTTSITAVAAINAALIEALKTGKGRLVDVSLLRTGLYTIHTDLAIQLFFDRIASTRPRAEAYNPLTNFFRTSDDAWICIVARAGNSDLPRMARAFELPGIDTDERFTSGRARRDNAVVITQMFDAAFAKFTRAEMAARLNAEEIAWSPAQTLAEVAVDPQVIAAGGIVDMPSKTPGQTFRSPGGPARFVGADDGPKGPGPGLGEHSREILASVGYSGSEIDALMESKAVA